MTRTPHPFVEEEVQHQGWHVYAFDHLDRPWGLTTIENGRDPPHSQFCPRDSDRRHPWSHYDIMSVPGVLTVDGCVEIISRVYGAYARGRVDGVNAAKAEIRSVLGIRN